jgi:glutamate racemase
MIGVMDSGIGGTLIAEEVRKLLPGVEVCYFRDSDHFPYGDRPAEEVVRIIDENSGLLVERGAKVIVLACNSASVVSLAYLRSKYQVPFVGVVPAVKPAAGMTKTKQIAVFGTALTSASAALAELIEKFCQGVTVHRVALEHLAEAIECGDLGRARAIVAEKWREYRDLGIDVVVLGCTHYPLIRREIEEIVGPEARVIDSNEAVARQVTSVWDRLVEERGDGTG